VVCGEHVANTVPHETGIRRIGHRRLFHTIYTPFVTGRDRGRALDMPLGTTENRAVAGSIPALAIAAEERFAAEPATARERWPHGE
jgi:hypothetical protein